MKFYAHTSCETDLVVSANIDPRRQSRRAVIAELQRVLRSKHGSSASDLVVTGFAWIDGRL